MKIQTMVCNMFSGANAWWEGSHNLIARMAEEILQKEDREVLHKIDSLLGVLENKKSITHESAITNESLTPRELHHPMVEAANFADDMNNSTHYKLYNETGNNGRW